MEIGLPDRETVHLVSPGEFWYPCVLLTVLLFQNHLCLDSKWHNLPIQRSKGVGKQNEKKKKKKKNCSRGHRAVGIERLWCSQGLPHPNFSCGLCLRCSLPHCSYFSLHNVGAMTYRTGGNEISMPDGSQYPRWPFLRILVLLNINEASEQVMSFQP